MSSPLRALILPGTSESGLEVESSLRFTRGVEVWSGSTDPQFATALGYKGAVYVENVYSQDFHQSLAMACIEHAIDVVFPAHDEVAYSLRGSQYIGTSRVVSHPAEFLDTARSKRRTYERLRDIVPTPRLFEISEVDPTVFPLFAKPDKGQGSRGARAVESPEELAIWRDQSTVESRDIHDLVVSEYLSGPEITVDCFSDTDSRLIFAAARERVVVRGGIAVQTSHFECDEAMDCVRRIGDVLRPTGAWFAQFRFRGHSPVLLEVGPRVAGSSGVWRLNGVNLSEMALHQAMRRQVVAPSWSAQVASVRRLSHEPCIDAPPSAVVFDFDDVILVNGQANGHAIALAAVAQSFGIRTSVVSRHAGNLKEALSRIHAIHLFDSIVHIRNGTSKAKHLEKHAWYFDDSFSERQSVVSEVEGVRALDASTLPAMMGALCQYFASERRAAPS